LVRNKIKTISNGDIYLNIKVYYITIKYIEQSISIMNNNHG